MSYISDKIKLVTNDQFGSHFIALKDIEANELLTTETPIIVVHGQKWNMALYKILSTPSIKSQMNELYPRNVKDMRNFTWRDYPTFDIYEYVRNLVNPEEVALYYNKMIKNCFRTSIFDICVYYNTSFFNHSCCPNAKVVSDPLTNEASCYSTININKGEQIFISYLPGEDIRTLDLTNTWGFACKCNKCCIKTQGKSMYSQKTIIAGLGLLAICVPLIFLYSTKKS